MATIILKATESCNANCAYCDVVSKERDVRKMPLETLRLVFTRINEYLTTRPEEQMAIIWHGGEPLLLGVEYFDAAYNMQEEHCGGTKARIQHLMQSNLTLFDETFVAAFRRLGIDQVGSSFDPVPHIRGYGAGERDSYRYNKAFMRGDALAKKHQLSAGVIYVVTKKSLDRPLEIFHYLANLKLGSGFDFHPVLIDDKNKKELGITPQEFVDFLAAILPVWWKNRNRYPDVDPFKSLYMNIAERKTSLTCCDSGSCAYNHINVAPDGRLSQCGRSSDWDMLNYGTIFERSFGDIMQDKQRAGLLERTERLKNTSCKGCRFWTICHGGCPLDSWFTHGDFNHKTNWCHVKRGFIEKHFEPVTGLRFEPFDE